MSDMLEEIGGDDVEIKRKEKADEVIEAGETEKPKSTIDTKVKEAIATKVKKVRTRKPKAKKSDNDYTSTMIRKDTLNLVKLMYPDDFIQDAIDLILTEWIDRNEKTIEQTFKRSLKRKNLGRKS